MASYEIYMIKSIETFETGWAEIAVIDSAAENFYRTQPVMAYQIHQ